MENNLRHFLFLVNIMFRDLRERILDLRISEKLKTKPLLKRLTDDEKALVLLCYICDDVSSFAICVHVCKCVCLNSCRDLSPLMFSSIYTNIIVIRLQRQSGRKSVGTGVL